MLCVNTRKYVISLPISRKRNNTVTYMETNMDLKPLQLKQKAVII